MLVKKKFWSEKNVGPKKNVVEKKIFGLNKIWRKKLPGKFFGSKKILSEKKFYFKNIFLSENFFVGHKKNEVQRKVLGPIFCLFSTVKSPTHIQRLTKLKTFVKTQPQLNSTQSNST